MRYHVYIVQALLAVNPKHPHWADVNKTAINGWRVWENHPQRVVGYHGDRFWTDVLAFHDRDTGLQCLADVRTTEQVHQLRLLERIAEMTETEVMAPVPDHVLPPTPLTTTAQVMEALFPKTR